jgi:hypothetical protein
LVRGYNPTINSRIKVRIQSLGTALKARKPKLLELDWSNLRAESVSKRERWWINTIVILFALWDSSVTQHADFFSPSSFFLD